ncbi:MAG TPA: zinc metallopeptidase [Candidatus Atribacteria bacterium]|nr:zinc metallopeptidase [Candidatus Atribacteria bacterium]
MFFFDSTMIFLIPAILLTVYAQYRVKTTYAKYSKILAKNGLNGKEIAEELISRNSLNHIKIVPIEGRLSDHYDPRQKKLALSREIYYGRSLAAQGIVAHEIGHALQDAKKYFPLSLRSNLVPVTNIGSNMAVPLFLIGFIFSFPALMDIGIIAFSLAVLFQLITLPVEFNASKRAVNLLVGANIVTDVEETNIIKKVLNAAALTYVAAASVAVFQLLRLILLRNRR